ncbi:hypothetical protein BLOT_009346 [Blomia tropicalis]|nr:hypothetical protein BLOT_009346 [Blomia tropicalis]
MHSPKKSEHGLVIEPKEELKFSGPFNRPCIDYFYLINPSNLPIAFKVKTTAPKRFNVKPVTGIVQPGASTTIKVMLQPFINSDGNGFDREFDPNKQKFMVQSAFVYDDSTNVIQILKQAQDKKPSDLMDHRFRCAFDENALSRVSDPNIHAVSHQNKMLTPNETKDDITSVSNIKESPNTCIDSERDNPIPQSSFEFLYMLAPFCALILALIIAYWLN